MVKSCWICKTSGNDQNKSYHRIPKTLFHRNHEISHLSAVRKDKWSAILQLPVDTSKIRICSDHFISGAPAKLLDVTDPDWLPTQKLKFNADKNSVEYQPVKKKEDHDIVVIKCRLCRASVKQESCTDIFHSLNKDILKMVSTILGHEIVQSDTVSNFGCSGCLEKVHKCYNLMTFFRSREKSLCEISIRRQSKCDSSVQSPKVVNLEKGQEVPKKNKNYNSLTQVSELYPVGEKVNENIGDLVCPIPCDSKNLTQNMGDSVLSENFYDKELIRSIIGNRGFTSDEESEENEEIIKQEKRKYDVQAVKIKSSEIKTLKCFNCYKKFINLDDLKMHKNFCKLFYCQLCKPQIFFKDKNDQLLHKKKYHSHPLVCHICGKNYSQTYLLKHFKNHFEDKRKCPCCDKMLKNSTILMSHIDNVHGKKSSGICEFCGGCFKNIKKHSVTCKFDQAKE